MEQKVTKSKRADNKKGKNRSRKHGKTQNRSEVKLKKEKTFVKKPNKCNARRGGETKKQKLGNQSNHSVQEKYLNKRANRMSLLAVTQQSPL